MERTGGAGFAILPKNQIDLIWRDPDWFTCPGLRKASLSGPNWVEEFKMLSSCVIYFVFQSTWPFMWFVHIKSDSGQIRMITLFQTLKWGLRRSTEITIVQTPRSRSSTIMWQGRLFCNVISSRMTQVTWACSPGRRSRVRVSEFLSLQLASGKKGV